MLGEGKEGVVATLQLLSRGSQLRLRTQLTVHTNITTVTIPLTAFNGRLTKVHMLLSSLCLWSTYR